MTPEKYRETITDEVEAKIYEILEDEDTQN